MGDSKSVVSQKSNDELWRIGIIFKKDCYEILNEILKCLKLYEYEWKIISTSYKIKCRKKRTEEVNRGNNIPLQSESLNVLIQIFSVYLYLIYLECESE